VRLGTLLDFVTLATKIRTSRAIGARFYIITFDLKKASCDLAKAGKSRNRKPGNRSAG
jgi:hypothetical protein